MQRVQTNTKHGVTCIAANHHLVHTEIMIAATADHVWSVLTNFESMKVWSPSFKGITGELKDGSNVTTHFDMGEGIEDYSATLHFKAGVQYGWSEDYDGIRDNHIYRIGAISPHKTMLFQTDEFKGKADWSTTGELAEIYLAQYIAFNQALKKEGEQLWASIS
jgi:hypothetical protein